MANANELLIKINADAKNAIKAFDDVKAQTEDLNSVLGKASLAGAAVFAALSAEVFVATRAFNESEQASNQLTQSLQNQGIFTEELRASYKGFAAELQKKTGIDDDQIVKAEAIAQSYLGQTKISKELAAAIVDLSTKTGSLDSAAQLVGRSIGTSTNALERQGIKIREGSSEAERYKQVLEQLQRQVGGQAEAAEKANGGIGRLKSAFSDLQEEIGQRVSPVIRAITAKITELLERAKDNKPLLDFAVALGAGVAAASGLVAIAGPVVIGLTAIRAAFLAVGVSAGTASIAMAGIPILLGALVAGVTYLALNWEQSWLQIRAVTIGSVTALGEILKGLRQMLDGALHFDTAEVEAGFDRIKGSAKSGMDAYAKEVAAGQKRIEEENKKSEEKQSADKKAAADKATEEERAKENREKAARNAASEVKLAQLRQESRELIAIKQEEAAILKNLEDEKNTAVIEASNQRLEQLRAQQQEQQEQEKEAMRQFAEEKAELQAELREEGYAVDNAIANQKLDEIRAQKQTERQVDAEEAQKRLSAKIAADNLYLADQKKFGVAYATINRAMHSEIYQGSKQAFGELAALQQSSNSTLKGIGKAAAIANIIIKTAESAMNIYAGFSTIPIIGPSLGVAGAAAAIAFGAEQVSRVTAAASGALVGGTGNTDNQPFMLTPGELVAPRRNFNEVVEGVQTERSGIIDEIRERLDTLSGGGGSTNITIQGDVLAEETFIDRLVQGIKDAVEFRNADLVAARTL